MRWSLIRSPSFLRAARRHLKRHPERSADLFEALSQLEQDPFHTALRTHKLTGALSGSWACSVGYDLRIIFKPVKQGGRPAVLLESMGTHDEVY